VANRRVLIILDNAAGEWQVRPLLPATPGNAVIITSRARLSGLSAAHWIVDVLRPDEAVDLLAKVAGPDRVAAEPEAARDIVGLCGYLPLAVQIAGRKLSGRQHWKLSRLVQRLGNERDRLSELEVGDLEVRASFSLSYEGRPEEERRAFRLLALPTTADFAPWVAAALLDIDIDEAEDVVDRLADAQLLEQRGTDATGQSRYRFHDLLRAFARERLGEAEADLAEQHEALDRLLTAYLTTLASAVETFSPGNSQGIGRRGGPTWSVRDTEAVRALVESPLTWFGIERVNVLSLVEQAYTTGMWEITWLLAHSAADLYEFGAHWADWEQTHVMGLEAARRAGDRLAEATMLNSLGGRALVLAFEQAFWRLDAPGNDPDGRSAVEANGSALARLEEAAERFSRSREIFAALGDTFGEATALHGLADASRGQGRFGDALEYFELCLGLLRRSVAPVEEARALVCLAMCHGDRREVGDGIACLSTSLSIARDLANPPLEAYTLRRLGDLYRNARQAENALANYNESLRLLASLPDPLWEPRVLFRRGEILAQINDPVGARRSWQQAITIMRQTGSQELAAAERRIANGRSTEPTEFIRGGRLLGDFDPAYFIDRVAASRRMVRILNTWTDLVTDANVRAFGVAVGAALDGGALVQILLLDPDSLAAEQRAADLRGTIDVRGLIRENLWRLDALRAATDPTLRARMTVRVYSETPLTAYHRWDSGALVSTFPVGHSSAATTQHETTIDSPLAQFIEQRFESLWSPDGSVSLQDYLRLPLRLTSQGEGSRDFEVAFVDADDMLYVAHEELAGLAGQAGPDGLIVELIGTFRHPARRRGRYRLIIPMTEPVGVRGRLETKYGMARPGVARLVDLGARAPEVSGRGADGVARRGETLDRS
jgi:tetratricopeptide (TPR) repeat protein